MMSAPSWCWICIEISGVNRCRPPSRCDVNVTPSSSTWASRFLPAAITSSACRPVVSIASTFLNPTPRLITWKPPLSVKVGPGQFMNGPARRPVDDVGAGLQIQVVRVGQHCLGAELGHGYNQSIINDSTALVVTPGWAPGHSGAISWTQISGPNIAAIDNDLSYSTWVKNLITGNYIFRCTVTQDDNQARYADVLITVNIPEMRDFASSSFDRDSKFNDSGIVKLNTNIASWSAKVAPNPISEKIYLKIESTIQDNATVMILDLGGRILYKENISINAGNNSYEINEGAGFSNGAYFLSIFSTSQRKVIEVIKIGQKE